MSEDELRLAWQKFRDSIKDGLNRDTIEKTSTAVSDTHIGFKAGFLAGRDSKGDGWCFDMDKAPLQVPCEIAYSFEGENRTKITFLEDGVCPNTGQIYGCGASWNGVNEYMVTVYAWRLANPPQPPQDRKEGS